MHMGFRLPRPVYLIDTPGFSDSKISEMEVVNMIRKWSEDNYFAYSASILYLTPITETRLRGSRHRTFQMLNKFVGEYSLPYAKTRLVVITTMWDTVHNEWTRNRAESNFAQLRDETLKEFVEHPGTDVITFTNTKDSALLAIDRESYPTSVFNNYTSPPCSIKIYMSVSRVLFRKSKLSSWTWPNLKYKPMQTS
ncbi:hypothetical protein BJ165DRAFT_673169 [Panaeolus papilionaceus]|nr:hypothetical protein BJ165DRAFT_673169 [Panaeolus papilionaceus]